MRSAQLVEKNRLTLSQCRYCSDSQKSMGLVDPHNDNVITTLFSIHTQFDLGQVWKRHVGCKPHCVTETFSFSVATVNVMETS